MVVTKQKTGAGFFSVVIQQNLFFFFSALIWSKNLSRLWKEMGKKRRTLLDMGWGRRKPESEARGGSIFPIFSRNTIPHAVLSILFFIMLFGFFGRHLVSLRKCGHVFLSFTSLPCLSALGLGLIQHPFFFPSVFDQITHLDGMLTSEQDVRWTSKSVVNGKQVFYFLVFLSIW